MDGILTINQPAALVKALFWIKTCCVHEDFDQRGKGACAAPVSEEGLRRWLRWRCCSVQQGSDQALRARFA